MGKASLGEVYQEAPARQVRRPGCPHLTVLSLPLSVWDGTGHHGCYKVLVSRKALRGESFFPTHIHEFQGAHCVPSLRFFWAIHWGVTGGSRSHSSFLASPPHCLTAKLSSQYDETFNSYGTPGPGGPILDYLGSSLHLHRTPGNHALRGASF